MPNVRIRAETTPADMRGPRAPRIRMVTGGQGGGAIAPNAVTGLQAWYDFSDITQLWKDTGRTSAVTADGDIILGVTDKSGQARHLSEATNGPTYKVGIQNSRSVARFDGTNDTLAYTVGVSISQPSTMLAVVKQTKPGANAYFAGGSANQATGMDSSGRWTVFAGSAFITGTSDRSAAWHVVTAYYNGASSSILNDGTSEATGNPGAVAWPTTAPRLGSHSGAGSFGTVDIGEVVIYSTALSGSDEAGVRAYLKARWATP